MNRVIVMGSPRSNGRSAHLAEMLFEANIDECPEDEIYLVPISELEIGPCIACGACRKEVEVVYEGDDGEEVVERAHRCIIDDEMQDVYPLVEAADELVVVSPVFFSGAPAPMKAFLDRMQPYFWAMTRSGEKRPATLHVIGEGGDPHGFSPLVSEVRSSLAVAGFRLERVLDWVGKIDESGEIIAEATVVENSPSQVGAKGADQPAQPVQRPMLSLGADNRKGSPQGETRQKDDRKRSSQGEARQKDGRKSEGDKRSGDRKQAKGRASENTGSKQGARRPSSGGSSRRGGRPSASNRQSADGASKQGGQRRSRQGKGDRRG